MGSRPRRLPPNVVAASRELRTLCSGHSVLGGNRVICKFLGVCPRNGASRRRVGLIWLAMGCPCAGINLGRGCCGDRPAAPYGMVPVALFCLGIGSVGSLTNSDFGILDFETSRTAAVCVAKLRSLLVCSRKYR